jgi:hypothetical protein
MPGRRAVLLSATLQALVLIFYLKNIQPNDKLIFNVTNRYLEASSTFRGDKFITDTLVTNRLYTLNISALRILNNGWSLGVSVPVSANSRNNGGDLKGLGTLPRYTTRSFGLGISGLPYINGY